LGPEEVEAEENADKRDVGQFSQKEKLRNTGPNPSHTTDAQK